MCCSWRFQQTASQPDYTTLANFMSSSKKEIARLFQQVLLICDAEGLIGKKLFAIDGCKLPSNASKEWSLRTPPLPRHSYIPVHQSGTHADKGRAINSKRLGAVEPVFANITHMIGIKRFSLRGKDKVNTQWQWMTMVHNIFK